MTEYTIYSGIIIASFVVAGAVFITLFFISAPYGRHIRRGWGLTIPSRLGWLAMEAPAALLFALYFIISSVPRDRVMVVFLAMWEAHYIHRAFIYPFSLADGRKKMPVLVTALAVFFNIGNTYTRDLTQSYPHQV